MNLKVNSITLKTLFFLTSFYIFLSQSPILYAQETAKITSPPPNTLLSSSTITFQWTQGQNITEYYLGVGTTFNSISNKPWGNIFAGTVSTTSKNISNIPLNGQKIFVRIWSKINNTWLFEDYNYPTEAISNKPAEIITPTPNTTLNQQEITFQWSAGLGVTNYYLGVGTNFNSVSQSPWGNIFAGTVTGTSKSISTIPLTGEPLFVRLWSKIAGSWQFIDYTYQTEKQSGGAETEPAELISPPFNTLIQNSTITFEWSQGKAVTQYYFGVGTSFNSVSQSPWGNIFAGTVTGTSKSISNIPLNGQKVFVRMWSKINNVWQSKDYSFDTERQTQNDEPAQMTIPAPDSILNESSISFQWTQGVNVSEYYLGVGTSFNSVSQSPWGNIFAGTVTGTSKSISGIILNGKPVFVRLWSKINSQWKFIDYTYQTENQGQTESPAEITTPAPGSTFSESIVTFQWTPGNNVTSYYLGVGKSFNSVSKSPWGNIFAGTINGTSKTVPNIPLSGESIFVRLWSKINGVWLTRDYTYNTLLDDSIPPSAPTNLTVTNITSTSMQINWKAATDNFTVAGYRLDAARDQNFTQFVPGFQNKDIANTLNHIITNLTSNTPYFIRLRAYDQAGNLSVNSTVISATTHSSGGPTTVDSNITVDTIWTADGSPYIIKNNIVVNSVSVLTIQPGTVIRFDGNFFLKVSGQMIAEGTATQPIVFTSNKTTPAISNWQYLELNNLSRIKNARIEYADSGLFTNNSGIVIENVISEHNRVGFFIQGGTTSLSNITTRNNVEGIHLSKGTLAQITQSTITTNQDGIFIDLDETGTNKNNTPNIIQNKIFNNINFNIKTKAASAAFSHQNKKINAKNNWWGTTNINEVEQKIFDHTDSQHAPQIIYDPILFDENGEAIIKDVSVNKVFITPQTQENSLIRYTLSMPSQVTIKFYNFETDVLVRTLTNNAARNAGINQESFNGKNDAATNLAKGVYYFIIEALTNTNQRGLYNPLHIPAPVQSINARLGPEHINPYLAETAQLTYDLQVPSWVTARIGRAGRATADRLLVNNQPRPSTNNIEIWDGRNDQGEIVPDAVYKSTIVATCLPVNAIVINEDPINLIEFVRATPYAIYPLYGETTTIDYKLLQPAKVTIEILNTNGTVLRTLLNNEQFSAGINNVIFNGKTDKQAVISTEGNYTIRVTADINGQKQIKEGYLKIFP